MGHLQSITSFKPCAFSLVPDGTLDPLYLETVEDRLGMSPTCLLPLVSLPCSSSSTHHTIPSHLKIPFLSSHYLVHPDIQTALSLPYPLLYHCRIHCFITAVPSLVQVPALRLPGHACNLCSSMLPMGEGHPAGGIRAVYHNHTSI